MRLFGRKSGGGVGFGSDRAMPDVGSTNSFRSLQDTTTGLTRIAFKVPCYPRKMSVRVACYSVSLKTQMSEIAFDYSNPIGDEFDDVDGLLQDVKMVGRKA
jgi:hypothetical protein